MCVRLFEESILRLRSRRWRQRGGMELFLNGFKDNGHYEAKAALFDQGFVFASIEHFGGLTEGSLHLFEVRDLMWRRFEQAKVGYVTETPAQQADQVAIPGGPMNFQEGEVLDRPGDPVSREVDAGEPYAGPTGIFAGRRLLVHDPVYEEGEVSEGG